MTDSHPRPPSTDPESPPIDHARAVARLDRLGRVLDDWVTIPGINYKIGIDSVLGLVPVIGDATSALLGGYIVYEGHKLGVPIKTLGKMAGNVGVDFVIGLIPGIGDVADFIFKSNRRNLKLLKEHVDSLAPIAEDPPAGPVRWVSRAVVIGLLVLAGIGLWSLAT